MMNSLIPSQCAAWGEGSWVCPCALVLHPTAPVPAVALSEQLWQQSNWKTLQDPGVSWVMEMEQ